MKKNKSNIIENYQKLFSEHGEGPEVAQYSLEGQRFRFEKLSEIGQLNKCRILEIGCGIGDLLPYLNKKFNGINYTGIDIVPELINYAKNKYPNAAFQCIDLLEEPFDEKFDYVLISGMFNNSEITDGTNFLLNMVSLGFGLCKKGIGFNFTSKHVNHIDSGMAYHDPIEVLKFCIEKLSKKVIISHHYERCDVSVFVYR